MALKPPWTLDELEYLADNIGRKPKAKIAKHLNRSEGALENALYRKLNGVNQRGNIYTARAVAQVLGISCSKTIVAWMEKGYIKGKRAPFAYGKTLCWSFEYEDIVACLLERPWLVNLHRMEPSYFRSIIQEEFVKNPWYGCKEAAPFFGLVGINAVHRYIYRGWLPALRQPLSGNRRNGSWGWVIRQSSITAFLENDPRPSRRRYALMKSRRLTWLNAGRPVPVLKEWLLRCPVCRHKVRILAEPNLRSPQIKEVFTQNFTTPQCSHGKQVLLERRYKGEPTQRSKS